MAWNDWKTRQRIPAVLIFLLAMLLPLTGCAGRLATPRPQAEVFVAQPSSALSLTAHLSPWFVLEGTEAGWNRIGQVEAMQKRGQVEVTINTAKPVIYTGSRSFTTATGAYTNLIYRIHFPEIPFSFFPFYLGAGKNVGLLVIITLDADRRPLLVTTANTCGCYATTIPTALLPPAFLPDNWPSGTLALYGERLPATLPAMTDTATLLVVVGEDVHRVRDVRVVDRETPALGHLGPVRPAEVRDLDTLKTLPLRAGATTSFYYEHWPLTGHVKGGIKPWESLLLSLVSLDFFVGTDKEYAGTRASGNPFYTSLKPWNRKASDMNDFAGYLRFNGWRL